MLKGCCVSETERKVETLTERPKLASQLTMVWHYQQGCIYTTLTSTTDLCNQVCKLSMSLARA